MLRDVRQMSATGALGSRPVLQYAGPLGSVAQSVCGAVEMSHASAGATLDSARVASVTAPGAPPVGV